MTTEIIFAGFGGQGVILAGKILTLAGMNEDKYVSHIPSYGAEMRGGTANCSVIVSDEEVAKYLSEAKALIFPGIEDFGIIPVEANAAGCPVLAYKEGGAIDSIKENETGLFFEEQTADSIIECMNKFEQIESSFTNRELFTNHVKQFSKEEFITQISKAIEERKRI